MRYFCTYFDLGYLPRGLALYSSLKQCCGDFELWVLCFDAETYRILSDLALPNLHPVAEHDFEEGDDDLLTAKGNRSRIEYYFTCTASLLLYILRKRPQIDVISYLDADLFFFSDPTPIYEELGKEAVLIIGHRFPKHLQHHELHGIYNVGLVAFRNDETGLSVLRWWRERCLESCSDTATVGQFADQKYLDDWPSRFAKVVVLQHQGAGVAPWNAVCYDFNVQHGDVCVDDERLIFYHFHALRIVNSRLFDSQLDSYECRPNATLMQKVYAPYVLSLRHQAHRVGVALANPRYKNDVPVAKRLLHGYLLLVAGQFAFPIHLEQLARPFLRLRRLALELTGRHRVRLEEN